jgi:hypothetical protein
VQSYREFEARVNKSTEVLTFWVVADVTRDRAPRDRDDGEDARLASGQAKDMADPCSGDPCGGDPEISLHVVNVQGWIQEDGAL